MIKKICRKFYCKIIYKVIKKEAIKDFYKDAFEEWFWDRCNDEYGEVLSEEDREYLEKLLIKNTVKKG